MKEQDKAPEKELNEVEACNLPNRVLKMILRMLKEDWINSLRT